MNIAICDDDAITIDYLFSLCNKISFIKAITAYRSPELLLADIRSGSAFDVILMDIHFESEKNGIDYSEEVFHLGPSTRIIYITGYADRFIQNIFLKQSNLTGFLIKPVQKDILEDLLKKAQSQLDNDKYSLVCNLGKGKLETIPCNNILYLESKGHNVLIHTSTGNKIYSVYSRLSNIEKQLPSHFRPCHKSYLINMNKIKRIDKQEITLTSGTVIQISKSYSAKIKEDYIRYMQKGL